MNDDNNFERRIYALELKQEGLIEESKSIGDAITAMVKQNTVQRELLKDLSKDMLTGKKLGTWIVSGVSIIVAAQFLLNLLSKG